MTKGNEEFDFEDMKTSELLDVDLSKVTAETLDDYFAELERRLPFKGISEKLDELREAIEELNDRFRLHVHKNGEIYTPNKSTL